MDSETFIIPVHIQKLYDLVLLNLPEPVFIGRGVIDTVQCLNNWVGYISAFSFLPYPNSVLRSSSTKFWKPKKSTWSFYFTHIPSMKEEACSTLTTNVQYFKKNLNMSASWLTSHHPFHPQVPFPFPHLLSPNHPFHLQPTSLYITILCMYHHSSPTLAYTSIL